MADTPGHEQYTRNMATGASSAQLAVILIDARKGVLVQTRRHSLICALLGIRHVIVAINKIDLVNFEREKFERIAGEYAAFAGDLGFTSVVPIPISARFGDNVIDLSLNTPWYRGRSLMQELETVDIESEAEAIPFRFPVQWINRPNLDFRGYAGTIVSGRINTGDPIVVATTGRTSRVKEIVTYEGPLASAAAGDAVTLTLTDDIDIARGDVLAKPTAQSEVSDQFAAHVIWMGEEPLFPGRSYLARVGTKTVSVSITALKYKVDVNTRHHLAAQTIGLNEIGFCNFSTSAPIAFDSYEANRQTGSFIIIDRFSNQTVGAGMVAYGLRRGPNVRWQPMLVGKVERAALKRQNPAVLWFTGLSGAGNPRLPTWSSSGSIWQATIRCCSTAITSATDSAATSALPRSIGWRIYAALAK